MEEDHTDSFSCKRFGLCKLWFINIFDKYCNHMYYRKNANYIIFQFAGLKRSVGCIEQFLKLRFSIRLLLWWQCRSMCSHMREINYKSESKLNCNCSSFFNLFQILPHKRQKWTGVKLSTVFMLHFTLHSRSYIVFFVW